MWCVNIACWPKQGQIMMTSSNGNIFHITGHLCGEFTGPRWCQWRGPLIFSLICTGMDVCVNNHEAGDLRWQHTHYDVTVMCLPASYIQRQMCCNIWQHINKLDESTARRQLKSPRPLSGRSVHLTLVTKWSWSWSWMTYCYPLCAMSIGPPILRYSYLKISMKIHGQGHVCGQKSR